MEDEDSAQLHLDLLLYPGYKLAYDNLRKFINKKDRCVQAMHAWP
jgi:hypothetical protein